MAQYEIIGHYTEKLFQRRIFFFLDEQGILDFNSKVSPKVFDSKDEAVNALSLLKKQVSKLSSLTNVTIGILEI